MAGLNVSVDGNLLVSQSDGCGTCGSGSDLSDYPLGFYTPGLQGIAGSSGTEIGQKKVTVSSPAAFVALPVPSDMLAYVVYVKVSACAGGAVDIRLTHETTGAVVYPQQHMLLMQVDPSEAVSVIEVQGNATISWLAVGVQA